jgi:hypothetical protein
MHHFSLLRRTALAALIILAARAPGARADQESDLLRKFQQQNQQVAQQAKASIEKTVDKAFEIVAERPEQALELFRQARDVLNATESLSRSDKAPLARRLDEGFRNVKARLDSQAAAAAALKVMKPLPPDETASAKLLKKPDGVTGGTARDPKLRVSPILFQSYQRPMVFSSDSSVTPIVSPDRRWVRISLSGFFSIR